MQIAIYIGLCGVTPPPVRPPYYSSNELHRMTQVNKDTIS